MHDTKIKFWLSAFVAITIVVGGLASLGAQKRNFYKGGEPLWGANSQASLLTIGDPSGAADLNFEAGGFVSDFSAIAEENKNRLQSLNQNQTWQAASFVESAQPQAQLIFTSTQPEAAQESTFIQGTPQPAAEQPAPLPLSCESQHKFTYTGPDLRGLLYGTCIECETMVFMNNDFSCPVKQ